VEIEEPITIKSLSAATGIKTADILNDARTELTAWVERKVGENVPAAAAKSDYTGGTPAQRAA